jgi:hypothetical protein
MQILGRHFILVHTVRNIVATVVTLCRKSWKTAKSTGDSQCYLHTVHKKSQDCLGTTERAQIFIPSDLHGELVEQFTLRSEKLEYC